MIRSPPAECAGGAVHSAGSASSSQESRSARVREFTRWDGLRGTLARSLPVPTALCHHGAGSQRPCTLPLCERRSGGCGGGTGVSEQSAPRGAALIDRISQLTAQAARLQDASEIRRLQRAYGYYVEAASWDQVADLFADDGSIEIGLDGVYQGKERVRAYLHALGGGHVGLREGQLYEHLQLQPVVDVAPDGRTARGRWRTLILAGQYHEQALWGEGPYENEYVKDNGVWKIKRLHWYQTFLVPYEGGWAKNRDLNGGIFVSKQLPPDRPPSERYETWPSVYRPPYHYVNPVTAAHPDESAATAGGARDADPAIADLQATVDGLAGRV